MYKYLCFWCIRGNMEGKRVILSKDIESKRAVLILDSKTEELEVLYNGEIVSKDATIWKDLKGTKLIGDYLNMEIDRYLDNKKGKEEFEKALEEEGWT